MRGTNTHADDRRAKRDPLARRHRGPPRRGAGAWLWPASVTLLGGGVLAAVIVLWLRLVPIVPPRERPPLDLSSIPPLVEPTRLMPIAPDRARALNARRPVEVTGPPPAVARFVYAGTPVSRARAVACLAAAAWYEAGDEPGGQRAVMQTVLNRARHRAFRPSVCAVVFQGSERATGCQFTFTCDGSLRRTPSAAAWTRATAGAAAMLAGVVDRRVGAATHYHADYVLPYWASSLVKLGTVGPHIFYTWPGRWGSPAALSRVLAAEEPPIAALARLAPLHASDAPVSTAPMPTARDSEAAVPAGIGDRQLRGATVRGAEGEDGTFFMVVDDGTFAGNHAVAALALCGQRPRCRVYGWRDPVLAASALPLSDVARAELTFFFAHDQGQSDRALWNCSQVARANRAQCLPAAPAARGALTG